MEQVEPIRMTPTLLRKFIKEKSEARISKASVFNIRDVISTFVRKLNKQLLIDNGKVGKITVDQVKKAFQNVSVFKAANDSIFSDLYFPVKPIHTYLKQLLKELFTENVLISKDALFFYQSLIELYLREFVQCVTGQMNHAKRKTIQDSDIDFCKNHYK